jgi:hypothetical protein
VKPTLNAGLHYRPAQDADEVTEAWNLVHDAYVRAGLIAGNRFGIHTYPQILDDDFAVILGEIQGVPVSTLSAYVGRERGSLPLESIFGYEIQGLRDQGKQLLELGLFADRRQFMFRSFDSLLELMRHATFFGLTQGCTDAVIGVHPEHASFYRRILGFDHCGEIKPHPGVKGNPAVLMHLDWDKQLNLEKQPRGIRYFLDHPLGPEAYANRCQELKLAPEVIRAISDQTVATIFGEFRREAG